jgi:hypothetical protein
MIAGVASGCSTTQEKAEKHQAQSEHILEARAERQQKKKDKKQGKPGQKKSQNGGEGQ